MKKREKGMERRHENYISIFLWVCLVVVLLFAGIGVASASKVTTNENGQIFVDGEPFFPIFISHCGWGYDETEEAISTVYADMKAAGFNTVRDCFSISSSGHLTDVTERSFRIANDNGLKVQLFLRNAYNRPDICSEAVNTYKSHPAAFSWEAIDEPTPSMIPWLEDMTANIKEWDPNHICHCNFASASWAYTPTGEEGLGEWMCADAYPIRDYYSPIDKYIYSVVPKFSAVYDSYDQKKPTAFWVQAVKKDTSMPTLEHQRFMTYVLIVHGATGIGFFSYEGANNYPELWASTKQIAGELNYLHDVLALGKTTETVSVSSVNVETWFRKVGNKGYLIAVNNQRYDIGEVTFTSPYYIHTAETLFETVSIKNVYGTSFTDTFDRLGVHVYELTLEEPTIVEEYIWIEGEDADTITSDFEIVSDASASNGKYLWVPEGVGFRASNGEATYTIPIDSPGDYVVWGNVIATTKGDNSLFAQFDDGFEALWTVGLSEDWQWSTVNHWGSGGEFSPEINPVIFNLPSGDHILKIKQREDGIKLDKLLITNDMSYTPQEDGQPTGTISGTVTDENGTAVEDATVTANGHSTTTDSDGGYTMTLPVGGGGGGSGSYIVTTSKEGYQSQSQGEVEVTADQTTTVNSALPLGEGATIPPLQNLTGRQMVYFIALVAVMWLIWGVMGKPKKKYKRRRR